MSLAPPQSRETAGQPGQATPSLILALREANFRWYWIGLISFATALEMQRFMLPWLAYELSDSKLVVGLVGLCIGLPNVLFSPFGGVLADRVGREVLIRVTQTLAAGIAAGLGVLLVLGSVQVWQVLAFALLSGTFSAFDQPSRQAIVPKLVPTVAVANAVALNSAAWQIGRVGGPALAGVLLALLLSEGMGPGGVFLAIAGGFGWMILCAFRIKLPPPPKLQRRDSMLRDLSEGIRFIVSKPLVRALILIVFANSLFGTSYILLMPVFAKEVYGVGEQGLGLLVSSFGVGGLLGTVALAVFGVRNRRGAKLLAASLLFALLLVLFAVSRSYLFSIPVLIAAGAMNAWYLASANTLLQLIVPDAIRGRVMGVYALTWNLAPVGGALSGGIAQLSDAPTAVLVGGLAVTIVSGIFAIRVPDLRKLD